MWKKRQFTLDRGKLCYCRAKGEGVDAAVTELNLVGARVSLLLDQDAPEAEPVPGIDENTVNAFVVVSGLTTVTVRCRSRKQVY